jgi:hypothetical protein
MEILRPIRPMPMLVGMATTAVMGARDQRSHLPTCKPIQTN